MNIIKVSYSWDPDQDDMLSVLIWVQTVQTVADKKGRIKIPEIVVCCKVALHVTSTKILLYFYAVLTVCLLVLSADNPC